jgi:hypothetical protein
VEKNRFDKEFKRCPAGREVGSWAVRNRTVEAHIVEVVQALDRRKVQSMSVAFLGMVVPRIV